MLLSALAMLLATGSANVHERAIRYFGGKVVPVAPFAASVQGLQRYLRASGVRRITAAELTAPHHPDIADKYGYKAFLPDREWWPRGAALALAAERIQRVTGRRLRIRNWWRPQPYNLDEVVGGASGSDHVTATAVDIDYPSIASCQRATTWLRSLARRQPWLQLSLGVGPTVTHVGIASPHGAREWQYQ
jgi:hypothetical protein